MMRLSTLETLNRWSGKGRAKRLAVLIRVVFVAAIAGYLISQLADIGWAEVWRARPRMWAFYALFVAMFLALPVSEAVIYGYLWNTPTWRHLPVMLRKRVYNNIVLDYSGEAYLCLWAKRNLGLSSRQVLVTVKDNNVLSAMVSAAVTVIVLAGFAISGQFVVAEEFAGDLLLYAVVAAVALALLGPVAITLRRHIISLSGPNLGVVLLVHCLRFMVIQSLRVAQWAVVLPDVALGSWFTFLAINILVLRLPFVPAKGLIFIGLGIGLSDTFGVPGTAFASLLLVNTALHYSLHFIVFGATSFAGAGEWKAP